MIMSLREKYESTCANKIIEDFPEEITGVSATPAADHLFKVREDGKKLNKEQADIFHHTVYQLLFAANRARQDIQTAALFLTTRVQAPDEDDWGKLKRVLKYLIGHRISQVGIERRCDELLQCIGILVDHTKYTRIVGDRQEAW